MGILEPAEHVWIDSGHGWLLELRRYVDPQRFRGDRRAVVMIPGYAMNTFILAFHPGGASMVEHLVAEGREVWTANLRGQGGSQPRSRARRFGMGELALEDIPAVLAHVRRHTAAADTRLDVIGCSLGASLTWGFLAHNRVDHGIASMIAVGGPLRWDEVHPLMEFAFRSPRLAGLVRFKGTRALARRALPVVKHAPGLLSIYMNARQIDLSQGDQLVNTVEDPVPYVNQQVARWVQQKDLLIRGVDVSRALQDLELPTMAIFANADGIVPPGAARSVAQVVRDVQVLEVGTADRWYAHADLFIGPRARREVFEPMSAWLEGQA